MTLKTHWLGSFAWNVIVSTTNVKMKLLEMGKDMKIKHSVSSPFPLAQSMERLFSLKSLKKPCIGEQTVLANLWGNCYGQIHED